MAMTNQSTYDVKFTASIPSLFDRPNHWRSVLLREYINSPGTLPELLLKKYGILASNAEIHSKYILHFESEADYIAFIMRLA